MSWTCLAMCLLKRAVSTLSCGKIVITKQYMYEPCFRIQTGRPTRVLRQYWANKWERYNWCFLSPLVLLAWVWTYKVFSGDGYWEQSNCQHHIKNGSFGDMNLENNNILNHSKNRLLMMLEVLHTSRSVPVFCVWYNTLVWMRC